MTPAEWNSGGSWGWLTPEMVADLGRLKTFIADIPLAQLNPEPLEIRSEGAEVRGWGVAGEEGGLIWVQDFSLQGRPLAEVRQMLTLRSGVQLEVRGLAAGTYTVHPFDTWGGTYLEASEVTCEASDLCRLPLPNFRSDLALEIKRK
jgi:hypothetical protein